MESKYKTVSLETTLPLLAVENGCIVSKTGDLTVAYRVALPEVFTLSEKDYEALHSAWAKALGVLPDYTIVHKQDWHTKEFYQPDADKLAGSFLSRSYEMHYMQRPYLQHLCFLMITMASPERMRTSAALTTLCRKSLLPQPFDKERASRFMDAVKQAESILSESGFIKLFPISEDDITGRCGLLEWYLSLGAPGTVSDIRFEPDRVHIGQQKLSVHTLSDLNDLPQQVSTDGRYERLSTDRSDCRLSFASPVGLLLGHPHVYNQYIFLDNTAKTLEKLESRSRNMAALSRYSRSNEVSHEWIEEYLNRAHEEGLRIVRCHFNITAWADNEATLKRIANDVGAQIAVMGCTPHFNTVDVPNLFWGGIPGNEGDLPVEETFRTFLEPALCFFTGETMCRSSISPFGIRLTDRLSGIPLQVDISDLPMKNGITANRNKFVLGPSGSGKSFFINHLSRHYYEQGAHVLIVDVGGSYQGLCGIVNQSTHGNDGIYYTYTDEAPICFNPFYVADGIFDIEKRESIKTLLIALWKREDEPFTRSEEVAVSNAVNLYLAEIRRRTDSVPCFNSFYDFLKQDYRKYLHQKNVREKEFDLENLLNTLEPYYRDGEYGYLLNAAEPIDLLNKRMVIFEIDSIKDHKILLPVVTLIIMDTFLGKLRKLKGVRKVIIIEEAWKAISRTGMAEYMKFLYKTVRKYFGEAITVTQEVDDIIGSDIVKDTIINNSDCKILLDQRKYLNKFDGIQSLLGLTEKEKAQILSMNQANDRTRKYKEVWIGLGGVQSAVYGLEVSEAEYLAYTTEESEKMEVLDRAERLHGDLETAIRQIAEEKKE